MLYIQEGLRTHDMRPAKKDLQEILSTWEPARTFLTNAILADYKSIRAYYAFSGKLKDNIRNNENVMNRDVIALDLDFLTKDIDDHNIYSKLKELLNNFEWYLYPSISNGFKGVRYRLVIPVNRPLESNADYRTVISFLNDRLLHKNILAGVDNSNKTWSQVFGLPIANQFYPQNLPIIRKHEGQAMPTEPDILRGMQARLKDSRQANRPRQRLPSTRKGGQYNTYTARLLSEFINGIGEGQRNNKMLELASYLIAIGLNNSEEIYNFMQVMNVNYIVPPLPDKEIESTLRSALKRSTGG